MNAVSEERSSRTPSHNRGVVVPGLLAAAGLAVIAWAVMSPAPPQELPYSTQVTAASPTDAKGSEAPARDVGNIERLEINVPEMHDPIARALIAREVDGRAVALDWQNSVTEPVLSADLSAQEVGKVTQAVHDHVPADAVILSWWDTSRKIRLVAQRAAPLDDPLARGLLIPAAWVSALPLIEKNERAFWGATVPAADGAVFSKFIDALLLDEKGGIDALAQLAPGKTVYLAVHLSDIWKVATARPDALTIASKDFPGSVSHDVMRAASQWLREQKLDASYAVEPMGNAVRVHYLPKAADAQRLIAKVLPFTSSNPMQLERLRLVFQHRGFWIYKIESQPPVSG